MIHFAATTSLTPREKGMILQGEKNLGKPVSDLRLGDYANQRRETRQLEIRESQMSEKAARQLTRSTPRWFLPK